MNRSNTAHQMYDMDKLLADGCTIIGNRVHNSKGYRICAELNQHNRPCQRIGRCPFHIRGDETDNDRWCHGRPMVEAGPCFQDPAPDLSHQHLSHACNIATDTAMALRALSAATDNTDGAVFSFASHFQDTYNDSAPHSKRQELQWPVSENVSFSSRTQDMLWPGDPGCSLGTKRLPYKKGWTKEEHLRFLHGLAIHGRGSWKQIGAVVQTRTPTQVQSHAQKYFLRQKQTKKVKKSIHDLQLLMPNGILKTASHECFSLPSSSAFVAKSISLPASSQEPSQMLLEGYRHADDSLRGAFDMVLEQSKPMNTEIAPVQPGNMNASSFALKLQNSGAELLACIFPDGGTVGAERSLG
jgi:SHAQKYF class myb-like DNA-binding protein